MAYLDELTKFEREVFRLITSDEKLMRAVTNTDKKNSLIQSLPLTNGQKSLPKDFMYKNLFPYPWIGTNMEEEKKAYITLDVMNLSSASDYYKEMSIAIYVFCHQDVIQMLDEENEIVNRINYILQRIERLMNQNPDFGIGKLKFRGLRSERISLQIPGRFIVYSTMDYDRKAGPRRDQVSNGQ